LGKAECDAHFIRSHDKIPVASRDAFARRDADSSTSTLPQLGLFSNPWLLGAIAVSAFLQLAVVTLPILQPLFKVAPPDFAWQWLMIAALALAPVTVVEVAKLVRGPRGIFATRGQSR
jgi:Ca2+-transporting ATPase